MRAIRASFQPPLWSWIMFCGALSAAALAPAVAADDQPIMTVAEVKAGMKGYGLTVFEGVRPEKFDVEILGVLKGGIAPRKDMIVCRLSHPRLQDIGVVAGMSGSPVYIDSKLLGAVGYGWTFSRQAIGGISPIEDMLEVYEQTRRPPAKLAAGPGFGELSAPRPALLAPIRVDASNAPPGVFPDARAAAEGITLEPLGTPLLVSGVCPASLKLIQETFAPYGFQVVAAGAAGGGREDETLDPAEIGGGYALTIPYMTGDTDMSAVGTMSYRKGDRMVAFGHPMMHRGDTNMPMAAGRVVTILPSLQRPFKIASALNIIGTVNQDRQSAIGGVFGAAPPMVPITVTVRAPGLQLERTYRYRALRNREFLPMLVRVALGDSIMAATKGEGESSADMRFCLTLSNGAMIEKSDFVTGELIVSPVAFSVARDVTQLLFNSFEELAVERVEAEVTVTDRLKQARLLYLRSDAAVYKPGETVRLEATFQPWREEIRTALLELQLPEVIADGAYTIGLHSASSRESLEARRAPGRLKPLNLEQLIEVVKLHFPANRTYLTLESREVGLTVRGAEVASLPASLQSAIDQSCKEFKESAPLTILTESARVWPYELGGSAQTTITVDRRGERR